METLFNRIRMTRLVCAWVAILAIVGCESAEWTRALNDSFSPSNQPSAKVEEAHRQEYIATKSHESMYWLLGNCVEIGMSYKKVSHIMGEDGTPETGDRRILAGGGNYRVGDEIYSFGPDSKGKTVYLAFREDRLVNFERAEFK
jgi:hypothetical protein